MLDDNLRHARWAGHPSSTWTGQLRAFLVEIGYLAGLLRLSPLDEERVLHCLRGRYSAVWEGMPRLAPSQGVCLAHTIAGFIVVIGLIGQATSF